jgi:flagellar hook assembly protein FlgD
LRANRTGATLVIVRRLLVVLLPLTLVGATPAPASPDEAPGEATVTAVELARGPARSVAATGEGTRFNLVGVHWRGPGRVLLRTRSLSGRWTDWQLAAPEDEDGPSRGTAESRARSGWHLGSPWWVGASDRVEVKRIGRVGRVRAYLVWSPPTNTPLRRLTATAQPSFVPRSAWGADESIRRAAPAYAPRIRFVVVHHTAGRNAYTQAEAPAIVKGIQLYHVRGNGWNDIGYNYLVDRFGTVYEGRYGGIDKAVVGAHARGFNTGSAGIALLGTYSGQAPTKAAQTALTSLIAWRLDVAHVDPMSMQNVISGGSERWPSKVPVLLRSVSGHRDTGFTECPGETLYSRLNQIASDAAKLGGPKIFDPRVEASAEGPVRFRARLSQALAWTLTVTRAGTEVARQSGSGKTLDWTWDATSLEPGSYRWSISAGSARPATGSVRAGLGSDTGSSGALTISDAAAAPGGITPNGDGQGDAAEVSFSLSVPANVTVDVSDAAGTVVTTLVDRVWQSAGKHVVTVDGTALADGLYTVTVRARTASSTEVVQTLPLVVSRTLGLVSAAPTTFSPNGDGRNDQLEVAFALTAPATVTVRIVRDGRWVASPVIGASFQAGEHRIAWDGSRSQGRLRDGTYEAVVDVTDGMGTVSFGVPFATDTTAPRVRIVRDSKVRIVVSEAATVVVRIGTRSFQRRLTRPGTVVLGLPKPGTRVRVVATDAAGNVGAPAVWRRPARKG